MIGVVSKPDEAAVVAEFFELFKTPWEPFRAGAAYEAVLNTTGQAVDSTTRVQLLYSSAQSSGATHGGSAIVWRQHECPLYGSFQPIDSGQALLRTTRGEFAAVEVEASGRRIVKVGYDLFAEVEHLLTTGQPVEHAQHPTLELHIAILRELIVKSGVTLVEIPPTPAGVDYTVCLTHDIDFVGIRRHLFDHTMGGFLLRATVGSTMNLLRGKTSFARFAASWAAALKLPFVYLGLAKDFWEPFEWYLKVEKGLSPTYYLIPFKHRAGDKLTRPDASRRASGYGVADIPESVTRLLQEGCEVGVHGIDAWHSVEKGREEFSAVADVAGRKEMGIRMHWLAWGEESYRVLEQAGYSYDSTSGYNEAPGYRNGATQVFKPLPARSLMELPMHVQDGALFFPGRLGLSEAAAWEKCELLMNNARQFGGVLTIIWHDRSHGPERFWGDFYVRFVDALKAQSVRFSTAAQSVAWFRARRSVTFKRVTDAAPRVALSAGGQSVNPPLRVRIHSGAGFFDSTWNGASEFVAPVAADAKSPSSERAVPVAA
ncbi:MAG: hypothetical protein RLY20_911 [Verrucomicrobiota bacterium]